MDKELVLAVAGSGKTYQISKNINIEKRNLILAFTHQNVANLEREVSERLGKIPDDTVIRTFDSFKYNDLFLPFNESYFFTLKNNKFKHYGVTINDAPKNRLKNKYNPFYKKIDDKFHYVCNRSNKLFLERLSSLLVYKDNQVTLKQAIKRIDKFYDSIYIDEFQDFRVKDFELLLSLFKYSDCKIKMFGDYYQHSVSGLNNSGKPFNKGNIEFVELMKKNNIFINDRLLTHSRRCSEEICDFVREKLDINIRSEKINSGLIINLTDKAKILEILQDCHIKKLVYQNSKKYKFNSVNWSYSKGDTYDETCVILTNSYNDLLEESFIKPKSEISINKLYVALTRSKGNVYIIKYNDFLSVEDIFLKE